MSRDATAAPVLRAANVQVTMTSPTSCDVTMALTIEGAKDIDHRVDAAHIDRFEVHGARRVGDIRTIGRTQSLVLQPEQATYELRYRAEQSATMTDRCPLWLPSVPTDGVSRAVRLTVDLPPATRPGGTMPSFVWTGTHGVATLGNLPAFVRVPFATDSSASPMGVGPVMDAVAVIVLVVGSVVWAWRRKR